MQQAYAELRRESIPRKSDRARRARFRHAFGTARVTFFAMLPIGCSLIWATVRALIDSCRKCEFFLGFLRSCRAASNETRNDPGHEANSSPRYNKTYRDDRRIEKIPEQGRRPARPHYGSTIVHLEPGDFAFLIHPDLPNALGMALDFNVSTSCLVLSYGLRDGPSYRKAEKRVELSLNLPTIC